MAASGGHFYFPGLFGCLHFDWRLIGQKPKLRQLGSSASGSGVLQIKSGDSLLEVACIF
jgi:hypothetical protein